MAEVPSGKNWICAQIGAREHYLVPRAIADAGELGLFITDIWLPPSHPLALTKRLAGRYHPALSSTSVWAPNAQMLALEAQSRLQRTDVIRRTMARNRLFQREAVRRLEQITDDAPRTLVAFSYACDQLFAYAKSRGWRTVLDQIDPAQAEERLIQRLHPADAIPHWPAAYWERWQVETTLADVIVVNSDWTRQALVDQGVPSDKMRIIPLAYEGVTGSRAPHHYPARFDAGRPMRVLFLGQITQRKGLSPLFSAIQAIDHAVPIRFDFVGPTTMAIPDDIASDPRVRFHGSKPHQVARSFYEQADVFILPTYSDGFALTQIEARTMGVPIITSRHCAAIVRHGVNGLLLDDVSASAITSALMHCLHNPAALAMMAAAQEDFPTVQSIGKAWTDVFDS
ncbi:MAG: glycosyltransferase family 4 protein [Sphingomonas sp.]|uniref:glycosyltransferase family 4 protein n=1 Tax=Sphingomonas sp. TaxID=28214 RepID=UPI0035A8909A|nr:glycosyltransferase family 4 protein [Sphingomonas sp.]